MEAILMEAKYLPPGTSVLANGIRQTLVDERGHETVGGRLIILREDLYEEILQELSETK
jgi:hypothetical protein